MQFVLGSLSDKQTLSQRSKENKLWGAERKGKNQAKLQFQVKKQPQPVPTAGGSGVVTFQTRELVLPPFFSQEPLSHWLLAWLHLGKVESQAFAREPWQLQTPRTFSEGLRNTHKTPGDHSHSSAKGISLGIRRGHTWCQLYDSNKKQYFS